MAYNIPLDRFDYILDKLREDYIIYGPKRLAHPGQSAEDAEIRYGEIQSAEEIVWDKKSNFSPREVIYPIVQTLLHFKGDSCRENTVPESQKRLLVFMRPCDANGIDRLDTIFLQNGGQAEYFYERLRERLCVVVMECGDGFDECFCVSMRTNTVEKYSAAARKTPEGIRIHLQDSHFSDYFRGEQETDYTPNFVQNNYKTVDIADIDDRALLEPIIELDYWKKYDEQCISCGGCNTVCISCSCFDTVDITYNETSLDGERRRVWSSCMLENFTTMAGGHGVRNTPGARMRFKTLHKIYDFQARFGGPHMCVGCGRCDRRCPQGIKFSETINGLAEEVRRLKEERKGGGI